MSRQTHYIPVTLPHPALPLADWADCYERLVPGPPASAIAFARRGLDQFPGWVRALLLIRNALVSPFGLKGSGADGKAEMVGFFPIVSQSSNQAVLGFDDTHLDFRIVVDVSPAGELAQRVSVTTLVRRKILFGRVYIALITPLHRLIVRTMLSRLSRPGVRAFGTETL